MEPSTLAVTADGTASSANEASLRTITLVVYILYGLGLLCGITLIIGVIIAHVKRSDAQGTIYESHLTWLIRTFWINLAIGLAGIVTTLIGIGALVLIVSVIWFIYRLVFGFLKFNDRKPIENPSRFF